MVKRIISFFTAFSMTLMLFAGLPISVFAEDGQHTAVSVVTPQALPENGELEKLWIDRLFYGDGVSFYKDYGRNHLKGASLELYELLRAKIEAISAGTDDITSFPINMNETFGSKTELDAGIRTAMDALMADLPADFYWYDKTAGYVYFSNQEGTKVTKIIFSISEDYVNPSGGSEKVEYDDTSETYKINVDSSKMAAARTAVQNAQAIAAKYADKSDYEKIIGYKNEICRLVEYNDFAADNSNNTPYGDPWQLVWVFDNDTSTDVVCEGYSKAFQYLCDLGGIECYTVSGDVNGGAHMWNIAVLDGKSYHVDVTWCDGGFDFCLKGAATSSESGFTMSQGNTSYVFDADTCSLYSSAGILTVSTKDYDPGVSGEISIEVSPKTKSIAVGDTFTLTVNVTATGDYAGIDGYLYFDCNETVISIEDNGNGEVTVSGIAEGETDLVVGWEPDENAGITLENPIEDTCTVTVTAAECEHEWGTKWEKDDDYHWHVCTKCGAAGTKTKHKMGPNDVGKEPTCTEDGKGTGYKCLDNCGYMEEGSVKPALGHDYKDVPGSGKEPTCVEEGKEPDRKCSRCDDLIEGETIPATGKHTPGEPVQENIVNATCTTAGSYDEVEYCTVCNKELSREHKDGEKLPHDMKEVPGSAKAPTCAEAGREADQKCGNCGYTETGKAIPATGEHNFENGVCSVCGAKETVPEPVYTLTPADVTTKILFEGAVIFTLEGYTSMEQLVWDIDSQYAAVYRGVGNGLENNQCKIVGTEVGGPITLTAKTFDGKILGTATITFVDDTVHTHTFTVYPASAATCTAEGTEAYRICSGCGKMFSGESGGNEITAVPVIPALGHNYEDGVCTRCGDIQSQTHTHTGGTATCTQKAICAVCGQEYGELLPHTFVNGICTVCGASESAHTHNYGTEWKYSGTKHWHECACGERADETLHTSDGGTVTKQPTAYETGVRTYRCTVCGGFMFSETIHATGSGSYPSNPYIPPIGMGTPSSAASNEPYIQNGSGKSGWESISDDILSTPDGETVKIKMNGTTELPKSIVSDVAGRDIDLVLDMGGYSWTINGMNVTKAKNVDMRVRKVNKIPESAIQEFFGDPKTVQLELRHSGDFGFTAELTVDIGNRYSGMYANSYCYKSRNFEFGDSSEIVNGKAKLRFTHASRWLITVDGYPVMEDVSSAAAAHSAGTPIDMSSSSNGVPFPEFDEKKGSRFSNKKRRLDSVLFVL